MLILPYEQKWKAKNNKQKKQHVLSLLSLSTWVYVKVLLYN